MTTSVRPVQTMRRPVPRSRRARRAVAGTSYHLFSGILAAAFLLPILWATLNSFKTSAEANAATPTWFPHSHHH